MLDRRRARFGGLRATLRDHGRTGFVIVLAAERLPVLESVELHAQLERSGMRVEALVVNKRSPADAGPLLAARHEQEAAQLTRLRSLLGDLPLLEVPLLAADPLGAEGLDRLAAHLR